MKKLLLLFMCFCFFAGSISAETPEERIAKLEAQVQELLKRVEALENALTQKTSTMKPQPTQPKPQVKTTDVPQDIDTLIREVAAEQFPDNFDTQKFKIEQEREAYLKIQAYQRPIDVPEEIFQKIKTKAADQFPKSFDMQLFKIEQEIKAYQELQQ